MRSLYILDVRVPSWAIAVALLVMIAAMWTLWPSRNQRP
jgi:hypothetical protein